MSIPDNVLVCFLAGQRLYGMTSQDKRPISTDLGSEPMVEAVTAMIMQRFPLEDLERIVLLVHESPEHNDHLEALQSRFGEDRVSACTIPRAMDAFLRRRKDRTGTADAYPYCIVVVDTTTDPAGLMCFLWQYIVDKDQPPSLTIVGFENSLSPFSWTLGQRVAEFANEKQPKYGHVWSPEGDLVMHTDEAFFWRGFGEVRHRYGPSVNPWSGGHELFLGAALATQP